MNPERGQGAAAGLLFAGLFLLALLVAAMDLPEARASAAEVAAYYQEHHDAIQVGAVLFGASLLAMVFFGAGLAAEMRATSPLLASAVLGSAVAFAVTAGTGGVIVPAALSFHGENAAVETVQSFHDLAASAVAFSGYFGAGLAISVLLFLRRVGGEPSWLVIASAVLIPLQLAAPAGIIDETGPTNPYDGVVTVIGALFLLGWAVALSLVLRRGLSRL